MFLYVLVHSWPTLCKPSWSEECLDRCKSYFVWFHTYHIKNAYLYVVNLKYNAIERASNQTVLEPFSTSTVIVTLSQLPLHCTAGYFTITNVRAEWAFALSSKCEGLDASPSHKLPKQHWRPLGQETNLQGCEGMGWLGGFLGGRQSSLRVKLMFGHSQILKAFKLYIKINWRIKRLKLLHGKMLQAFLKTLSKPCPPIHCNFAPPWHSSSKALGQDMAFSATLTMVLKVTRSGCSGVACIEDLQKSHGKTGRWKKPQFFKNDDILWGKGEMMLLFRRNENLIHRMSKELETKLVRLFKNYMNHNQIASKAQQFNCSRPCTCFPKDGAPEQRQQPSWSCDLTFGVQKDRYIGCSRWPPLPLWPPLLVAKAQVSAWHWGCYWNSPHPLGHLSSEAVAPGVMVEVTVTRSSPGHEYTYPWTQGWYVFKQKYIRYLCSISWVAQESQNAETKMVSWIFDHL